MDPTNPPSTAPIIDHERLELLAEAIDAPKLLDLGATARQSMQDSATELNRSWMRHDGAAGTHAHRLAGVAANFGCAALAELAAAIEADWRAGGDGRHWQDQLNALLATSLAALGRALGDLASPTMPHKAAEHSEI